MAYWYFPSNDHGENKGINDSGVATFRGTPLKSLAREICQNSLDAATDKTVRVDFSNFEISTTAIPDFEVLKATFEKCLAYWNGQKAKTTKDFFKNAYEKISTETVSILRISDFKTKGLTGSKYTNDINTDWMRLTKSSGSSDKKGPAGGSFGIGKFAPFACSDFSTVFYNTYDIEDVCAYQGVSRLVTFERDDGETTQGIGYYGNEKNTPVYTSLNLDPSFSRDPGDYGTDVYVLGYRFSQNNWETDIVVSILDSFLGAIWNEKLSVNVGSVKIDKSTLADLMEEYSEELANTYVLEYYQVLTSPETKWFETNHLGLGTIKLGYLLNGNDFHRKVSMIRQTGMKIKDGDRINGFISFAGVLFIEGDKINEKLRALENPEHTEWQPDRAANPFEAKQLIKSINDYMKKCLEELVEQGPQNAIDAVGVANFIPDTPDEDENQNKEEAVSDNIIEMEKRVINRKHIPDVISVDMGQDESEKKVDIVDGESEIDWQHGEVDNPPVDPPRPPSPVDYVEGTEKTVNASKEIKPSKFMYICSNPDEGRYMIDFVPSVDSNNGTLNFYLSGETEAYKAGILKATLIGGADIKVRDNSLVGLTFCAGQHIRINMQIDHKDYCSMEVKAYVNKK